MISDAGWSALANFLLLFIAIVLLLTSPAATQEVCTCPDAALTANMTECFAPQTMEEFYLADKKFLAGNSISIADLLYSCELDEMRLLDGVHQVRPPTPLYIDVCNVKYHCHWSLHVPSCSAQQHTELQPLQVALPFLFFPLFFACQWLIQQAYLL